MLETLEGRLLLSADVVSGILTVTGTSGRDSVLITHRGSRITVREGRTVTRFNSKTDQIQSLAVNGLGGNDKIVILSKLNAAVNGGDGNDWLIGGLGNDVLVGGNGKDKIIGLRGNDSITGGAGRDILFGGAGDDTIDAFDSARDLVGGGAGSDKARVDENVDRAWNVEEYLTVLTNSAGKVTSLSGSLQLAGGKLQLSGATRQTGGMITNTNLNLSSITTFSHVTLHTGTLTIGGTGIVQPGLGETFIPNTGAISAGTFTLTTSGFRRSLNSGAVIGTTAGSYDIGFGGATMTFDANNYAFGLTTINLGWSDYVIVTPISPAANPPVVDQPPVEEPVDEIPVEPAEEQPAATE
jgi:hypothetical protein